MATIAGTPLPPGILSKQRPAKARASGLRLLVVEDDEDDFLLIQDLLRQGFRNVDARRASSVDEALAQASLRNYDVLICDYRLGRFTGLDLLRRLRASRVSAPVIFLTGQGDEEIAVEAMKAGAVDYLLKSKLNAGLLGQALRYALELQKKEAAVRESHEALRTSEERYRTLFERNLAGVMRTRLDGSFVDCNDALARMLGFESCTAAMAANAASLYEQPEDRQKLLEHLLVDGEVVNYEIGMRRRDGSPACMLANISLQRDERGEPSYLEGTLLDITERRNLQQQLLQAQKMEAVGQLAGGIAHDFNNLLLVMSGYAELLMDSVSADSKLRRNAEAILKAARRAAGLTAQLLAFSRKQVLSPQVLNLNLVLEEMAKMLPRLIGENIDVKLIFGPNLWKVKADPVQIEQVLMNLAVNARDAMPEGGQLTLETANVHLDEEYVRRHAEAAVGDYVMLAVTDSGKGIPPEVLPRVFEPFFTTKEKGKGTGLGLPTVYGIVKQSGGFVWVYSEAGHGTVFKVFLPREQGARETLAPLTGPETQARGSETILLVEDEEAVREAAAEYLTLRGYNVMQAENGLAALEMAGHFTGSLDLVISDVIMPGMGGPELVEHLRELLPQTRVLFVSGYTESTALTTRDAGNCGFLQKPFTLHALVRKVREMLDSPAEGAPKGSATM